MSCTFEVFNVSGLSKRAFGGKQVEMILWYLFRTSRIRIIRSTQILARVFVYLPPFISQILDFICRTILILILIYFEWRDTENQQYFGLEHNWIISLSSWDFKWFWDRSTPRVQERQENINPGWKYISRNP